jgi:hypothetical protein
MLRLTKDGEIMPDANRRIDLTPAELHRAILAHVTPRSAT